MKKLAMLLAVLMLAVAAFSVSAFEDVTVNDACFDAVNTLTSLEVIKGKTETTFAPEDPVTREQMAMLFTRLYTTINIENGENMTPFTDLDDPYFNSAIAWCYDAKVINGTSTTTFEPKAHIIYQDALTMACRLLGYTDLTYPLGNITKARMIGLSDGLEGTAYDKELTRGEVAIILYNALDAEGAEIVKSNEVVSYPYVDSNGNNQYLNVVEAIERNFQISLDVYNFKKETYQIVATENFRLNGYANGFAPEETYTLAKVDASTGEVANTSKNYAFEKIGVAEDTNSDDNILAYLEIIYRGDSLDDKKAVILSSVINSNLEADADVAVYFSKESGEKKETAKSTKVLVNGKVYDLTDADEQIIYSAVNGVITVVTDLATDPATATFYQDEKDVEPGLFAQKTVDADKDGTPDYIIFCPMTFEKVEGITTKGKYTFEISGTFETEKDDCMLVLVAEDIEKGDYVLTYNYGKYTVVDSVVEPVVTTVSKTLSNGKIYLATGDVVTPADATYPVLNNKTVAIAGPTSKAEEFYIIGDKIVFTTAENAAGYDPYTYAYFLAYNEVPETSVDPENGALKSVYSIVAFMNGKAVTIPVDAASYALFSKTDDPCMITIKDFEEGKYEVVKTIVTDPANAYVDKDNGFEIVIDDATFRYDKYTKRYKIDDGSKVYNVNLTAETELYAVTLDGTTFDFVKRYTMANMPEYTGSGITLDTAVIAAVRDADNAVIGYNFVVGYIGDVNGLDTTTNEYQDYRIVLSSGVEMDEDKKNFTVYEVLNPINGATEILVNKDNSTAHKPGSLVYMNANGSVDLVRANSNEAWDAAFSGAGNHVADGKDTRKFMQINSIIDGGEYATVYTGKAQTELTGIPSDNHSQEINLSDVVVRIIDLDEKGNIEITEGDVYDLEGKVVRTYVTNGLSYKPAYMVVMPYEWALEAGFADQYLTEYDECEYEEDGDDIVG